MNPFDGMPPAKKEYWAKILLKQRVEYYRDIENLSQFEANEKATREIEKLLKEADEKTT